MLSPLSFLSGPRSANDPARPTHAILRHRGQHATWIYRCNREARALVCCLRRGNPWREHAGTNVKLRPTQPSRGASAYSWRQSPLSA